MVTLRIVHAIDNLFWGFVLAACLVVPGTFWVADVWWGFIDTKSIQLAQWIWVWNSVPQK
jgi:hypothetical protein